MQIKSDQMSSHQNGKSRQVTLNFNGESTKYVREGKSNAVNETSDCYDNSIITRYFPTTFLGVFFQGQRNLGKVKSTKKGHTVQWVERVIAGLNISLNLCQL